MAHQISWTTKFIPKTWNHKKEKTSLEDFCLSPWVRNMIWRFSGPFWHLSCHPWSVSIAVSIKLTKLSFTTRVMEWQHVFLVPGSLTSFPNSLPSTNLCHLLFRCTLKKTSSNYFPMRYDHGMPCYCGELLSPVLPYTLTHTTGPEPMPFCLAQKDGRCCNTFCFYTFSLMWHKLINCERNIKISVKKTPLNYQLICDLTINFRTSWCIGWCAQYYIKLLYI